MYIAGTLELDTCNENVLHLDRVIYFRIENMLLYQELSGKLYHGQTPEAVVICYQYQAHFQVIVTSACF